MKLLATLALLSIAQAQPAFEVASVKPAGQSRNGVRGGCHGIDSRYAPNEVAEAPPLGRCVITDGRLSHMLRLAFRLRSMGQVKGGPDWLMTGDDRFNLEAKAEDPSKATEEQLLQMLQALLIDRFQIKLHRESKDMPGFELVVGKNGPKLKDAKSEDVSATFSPNGKPSPGQLNTLTAHCYSMPKLADLLSIFGEPVVDKTGLTGNYDFTMSWDDTNGPALSTALQQQLGLKFESAKVPVSFIVIESAQKPTGN
jgi:uncharacterized protein (TIGR03435 family)